MVRNYKKTGIYGNCKHEFIDAVVTDIKTKLMSVRGAPKEFGIPPTTMHNWVQAKVRYKKN